MEGVALAVGGWLAQPVINMLVDRVWTLRGKLHGLQDDDLQKLHRSLLNIHTIVDKAGMRWSRDARLVEMMKQLQDAAYDAEDFLDELTFHGMKQKIKEEASHKVLNQFSRAIRDAKTKLFSDSVKRLNKIQKKLDDIYADMERMCQSLQVDASDGQYQSDLASTTRETSSLLISKVLGREEEQQRIIELLLRSTDESASDNGSSFSVIPLVGIGGVGKTTLAQLVYKDEEIQNHFAHKIWICVSENFNVQRLTKEMIESVTETEHSSHMKLDVLQNILKREIASKMILLVLDNVWNEDEEEWRKLCSPFMYAAAGSKVIVTTRSLSIANKIGSVEAIVLGDLGEISFWELFKQCAFGPSKPEEHPELVEIGRSIASKLKGLPLAAKTVGNLLRSNMNPHHWRSIMKSEVWELQQNNKNDIIPVLQLSYQYLSAPLKRCFAFCSLFQKDYKFSKLELTRMWMAEGFVVAQGNQRMEDVASQYFHELVNMSLFQQETSSSLEHYFVMHDLIHDLTQSVSVDETIRMDNGKSNKISTTLRHLAVETGFIETKELRSRFKKLHSLFCQHLKSPPLDFIEKIRSIRVLVLSHCRLHMLPTSVGELVHLRYLDISNNEIEKLPESLCKLYNLQTLKANYNWLGISFPDIIQLVNLRHLDVDNEVLGMIKMIGRLTSLQELYNFHAQKEVGFKITELSGLKQLHGKLRITNLENVESKEEAEKAQMKNKEYLDALELRWGFDSKLDDNKLVVMEEVLEGLQPHESLKRLKIRRYCGATSPSWMKKEELSNLEILKLSYCKSWKDISCTALLPHLKVFHIESSMWFSKSCFEVCGSRESKLFPMLEELQLRKMNASEELPNLGRFPCLKVVRMTEIESLKHIDFAASGATKNALFPMLEELELRDMPALEEISNLGHFPRLRFFRMIGMPLLKHIGLASIDATENDLFPMLEELQLMDLPVLEELPDLGSLPCLKSLRIIRMSMLKHIIDFAFSSATEKVLLPRVETLVLDGLKALEELPSNLGRLPCLKFLQILNISVVKQIGHGFFSTEAISKCFLSLESLFIIGMPACEGWCWIDGSELFPRLQRLFITGCPKLERLPPLPPSLTHLTLGNVGLTELPSLQELETNGSGGNQTTSFLSKLQISKCNNLTSLEEGLLSQNLSNIEHIYVTGCNELMRIPLKRFENFTSLKKLQIEACPKLSLTQEEEAALLPPSFKVFILNDCGDLNKLRLGHPYRSTFDFLPTTDPHRPSSMSHKFSWFRSHNILGTFFLA
ncbi:putative disease resistance protein RGA1 [Zingiber officinale]|uniref:putative disease resistance protein RGA1 n=1 Tax=Zingiber officinale TaxID=94328 RepID=UPI001C4C199D|nr:putative disease resistance protein RGA1 [Zingiber officinale]XP_042449237.1 putative disease resistance protein RGA1 [Zingiber officinale]XP_042449238.1 putative disease resistance protein RGA1 [Zingiber officinale]XP_042449239.1 putative disease resistance protein RGA1 [Zingiber officinale]XP_042449240.1 putative disease resistance protein RGA1 [Zingiber officinale]XP_042449241.1 putative disease resistance protein RGA1 [Zingiber officinale]XP_042449242.1 putative disease resistance prot